MKTTTRTCEPKVSRLALRSPSASYLTLPYPVDWRAYLSHRPASECVGLITVGSTGDHVTLQLHGTRQARIKVSSVIVFW